MKKLLMFLLCLSLSATALVGCDTFTPDEEPIDSSDISTPIENPDPDPDPDPNPNPNPIPESVEVELSLGGITAIGIKAGQYAYADMYFVGEYTVTWDAQTETEVDLTVTYNGSEIENGATIASTSDKIQNTITFALNDSTEYCTVLVTLTEYVKPKQSFELGTALGVEVESTFDAPMVEFTATEAGKYVIKTVTGETNAWVHYMEWSDAIGDYVTVNEDIFDGESGKGGSYQFELEAGETIAFWVGSWSESPDTIDLVVEKYVAPATNDGWTKPY